MAHYTMLHATKSVHLPITVRLIFVGFEGDGNQGLDLDLHNLGSWFEHIEHTLHHAQVHVERSKGINAEATSAGYCTMPRVPRCY